MKEVLIDCAKIERLAADIYRRLAGQPVFSEQVRKTFRRLAEDEREHAAQIEMVLQHPLDSLEMLKRISGEKIIEALAAIKKISAELDQHAESEEAALSLAINLEENFMRFHLEHAIHFESQQVAEMFDHLSRGDAEHLEALNLCLNRWYAQLDRPK